MRQKSRGRAGRWLACAMGVAVSFVASAGGAPVDPPRDGEPLYPIGSGRVMPPELAARRTDFAEPVTVPLNGIRPSRVDAARTPVTLHRLPTGEAPFVRSGLNEPLAVLDQSIGRQELAPSPIQNFSGITQTALRPPDPDIACGGAYVLAVVNDEFATFDKCGVRLAQFNAKDYLGLDSDVLAFDPKVAFDPWQQRWIMLWHARRLTNPVLSETILVVSANATPPGVSGADIYFYRFNAVSDSGGSDAAWADYYDLGFGPLGVYASGNQFRFSNNSFRYARIRSWDKAEVYSRLTAGTLNYNNLTNPDGTQAASPRTAKVQTTSGLPAGTDVMFINSRGGGGDKLTLWKIVDPFGAGTLTRVDITVPDYTPGPDAVQPNGSTIDTLDCRLMNAVISRDVPGNGQGRLFCGLTQAFRWSGDTADRAALRLFEVNPSANTVTFDRVFGGPETYYIDPTVAVDYQRNALWVFTRCSDTGNEFPGARYIDYLNGTFSNVSANIKAGEANYSGFRWGDYFGGQVDFGDYYNGTNSSNNRIWLVGQYAESNGSDWGTWVGMTTTNTKGTIAVTPSTTYVLSGRQGGPFTPASRNYTVSNSGEVGFSYRMTGLPSWLTSSDTGSELYQGGSQTVTLAAGGNINSLAPGVYNANVVFGDCYAAGSADQVRAVQLTVLERNDECDGAVQIGEGTTVGSTTNNTGTVDDSPCGTGDTVDEWYYFVPTVTGWARVDTCNSAFNTTVNVIRGTCNGAQVACGDNYRPCGDDALVEFQVTANTRYYVRVSGVNGATGAFRLTVSWKRCRADFNDDGVVDTDDFFDFLNAFNAGNASADFNADGVVDTDDFFDFLNAFNAGC